MSTHEEETEAVVIESECLCKRHKFTASVPRAELPLQARYCHCSSCRHITGNLYCSVVTWPGSPDEIAKSDLARFKFSPRFDFLFCRTCFTPLFFEEPTETPDGPLAYNVLTGSLSHHPKLPDPGLVRVTCHKFVQDTLDGGALPWLRRPNLDVSDAPRVWAGQQDVSEELPDPWPPIAPPPPPGGPDEVPVRCRCGGVDLVFRRAASLADFAGRPRDEIPGFFDPETHQPAAALDACDSCRKSGGADVFFWTFVQLRHVDFADPDLKGGFPTLSAQLKEAVLKNDARFGTLALYASSPDVQRYSCSRCSATVMYGCDDRTDLVDLAVGLLDAPGGARAEGVLSWSYGGRTGWREDVEGGWREGLLDAMEREVEGWRVERGYPKSFWRIRREGRTAPLL